MADRRKLTVGVIAAVVVGLPVALWVAFGYFGVHKLWVDDEVDEQLTTFVDPTPTTGDDVAGATTTQPTAPPTAPETTIGPPVAVAPPPPPVAAPPAPVEPPAPPAVLEPVGVRIATGMFTGVEGHRVAGTANLIANPDGTHVLQFPDLDADNGPDLVVWLSVGGSGGDILDLGELKGNVGNQEYLIPADIDVSRFDTAVIWCRRFTIGFGEAPLNPV